MYQRETDRLTQIADGFIIFAVAFSLTFGAGNLTKTPGMGPGDAAGWAAGVVGAGFGKNSVFAPLFREFLRIPALLGTPLTIAPRLNFFTLLGHSLFAGFTALFFMTLFHKWQVWGAASVGALAGTLVGISRMGWASGLIVNPAPWALAITAAACFLLTVESSENHEAREKTDSKVLLAFWLLGTAVALSLQILLILPAILVLSWKKWMNLVTHYRFIALILGIAPLAVYMLPPGDILHPVAGMLSAPAGIIEARGVKLVGWAALWAMTPAALPLAIIGLLSRILRNNLWQILALFLLLLGIFAGGLIGGETAEFAAIMASAVVTGLMILGVVYILNLLPGGYAMLLWLIVPAIWIVQGPKVDRSDEQLWPTHTRNVLRTVRFESLVLSTDEMLINTPYAFMRKAHNQRPDLMVIDPLRLNNPDYLRWMEKEYFKRLEAERASFEKLKALCSMPGADKDSLREAKRIFLTDLVRHELDYKGVLVSPTYMPPMPDLVTIPEGLLIRIQHTENALPYHFAGLEMEPIYQKKGANSLRQKLVAQYPMMFAARGDWMLDKHYTAEGMDYIRWALQIDPDYIPAKLVAKEYGIRGEPLRLGK